MNSINFTVLGDPAAQKRHRHVKMGTFVRTYDPHANEKLDFLGAVQHHAPTTPFEGPLELNVRFFFMRPKSHFKTGKNAHILKDDAPDYHTSRKDVDNLVKFCTDAMNKVFYKDDGQICRLVAEKKYSDRPRTELLLTPISGNMNFSTEPEIDELDTF